MNAITDIVTPLGCMAPGNKGTVLSIGDDAASEGLLDRLREIGFSEGIEVELLHASLTKKGPIAVRAGRSTVALRRHEANQVKVQLT